MSTQAIQVRNVTKKFGDVLALNNINLSIEEHKIYGLLGRNGAGKTTLMQLLTGQDFPTEGSVAVLAGNPVENSTILQEICFIKESQRYPDNFKAKHVLKSAPMFYKNWDTAYADQLVAEFRLPLNRTIKKMSRGQQSALGVILGLASRAPITYFDEPYLGLDAVARQLFYDHLLEDFTKYPRTVILSTHLIDEVSNLLEHIIVIDQGEILIDQDADEVRGRATNLTGRRSEVEAFSEGYEILHRQDLGGIVSITINHKLSAAERQEAAAKNIELTPVSLQQLIVHATSGK
ncbi:MAG: ABC transporter ATP-binding protein [Microbacteriaceae bacterium]